MTEPNELIEGEVLEIEPESIQMKALQNQMKALQKDSSVAAIDLQVRTAKQFPRDIAAFRRDALQVISTDQETAESCFYKLPRRKFDEKTKKWETTNIEGPSVRLAEIAASFWGNLRVESKIVGEDDKCIIAQSVVIDLERNNAFSAESRRRIFNAQGKRYTDEMVLQTAGAATSIAIRNAVFRVIPKSMIDELVRHAKKVAVGNFTTLVDRRKVALDFFQNKVGVKKELVLKALGRNTIDEVTMEDLETMTGWKTALKDGNLSPDFFKQIESENQVTPESSEISQKQSLLDRAVGGMRTLKFTDDQIDLCIGKFANDFQKLIDALNNIAKSKDREKLKEMFFETMVSKK